MDNLKKFNSELITTIATNPKITEDLWEAIDRIASDHAPYEYGLPNNDDGEKLLWIKR